MNRKSRPIYEAHALLAYGVLLTGNQGKLTGADGDHWVQPNGHLCANNAEVLRDAAIKSRGVALLPSFIADTALRDGSLQAFLDDYKAPQLVLYAIYRPARHLPVKVRLFIDFLVECYATQSLWRTVARK